MPPEPVKPAEPDATLILSRALARDLLHLAVEASLSDDADLRRAGAKALATMADLIRIETALGHRSGRAQPDLSITSLSGVDVCERRRCLARRVDVSAAEEMSAKQGRCHERGSIAPARVDR